MMRLSNTALGALGAVVLTILISSSAAARVGVTSMTNGDPLGKPPAEAERILRIGVDVQANELITTAANDRAHLVFLDGSSLTVGPNARLVIDKFVYDPDKKVGELAISASAGVFRLVGGRISKHNAITVTTPSSTIGVRGGIALFEVTATRTTSTFAFGLSMVVSGHGFTETVTRPGWQVTTAAGATPGRAVQAPVGSLTGDLAVLEGRPPSGGGGGSGGGTGGAGGNRVTTAAATVIVNGTQALAAQPPTQVSATPPMVAYQNPQAWNPAPNLPSGTTSGGNLPTNPVGNGFILPLTGSATYNGTFSGSDSTGTNFNGTFSLGWNFGSRSGTLNASGTGGGTATAPLSAIGNTVVFSGPLTVTNLGGAVTGTGTVAGLFTSPNSVAGAFAGTGTGGRSTFGGTFSGHR